MWVFIFIFVFIIAAVVACHHIEVLLVVTSFSVSGDRAYNLKHPKPFCLSFFFFFNEWVSVSASVLV